MLITKSSDCPHCGAGHANQCYVIYDNGEHCFSCGYSKSTNSNNFAFKPSPTIFKQLIFPDGVTNNYNEFSLDILKYLNKYYINKNEIYQNKVMFVPYQSFTTKAGLSFSGESLLFLNKDDTLVYGYQRRFFPNKNIISVGDFNIPCVLNPRQFNNDTICVVEDYISAVRLSEFIPSLCLFGTSLKSSGLTKILEFKNIILWLDGDNPGQQAAKKISLKLCDIIKYNQRRTPYKPLNYTINNIATDLDPKCYSNTELTFYLKDYIRGGLFT